MRNFRITLFVLVISTCIFSVWSCNPDRIYVSHVDPPGNLEWDKRDALSFDVEIIDTSIKYDLFLAFRHAVGYPFSACSIQIVEKFPDGEILEHYLTLKLAENNSYISDCAGDICDLEELWQENRRFEVPGIYHYEITHDMSAEKLQMVMEVGMIVEKVKP
ncbi:MAG: gliding motility lipoprotein GldH [Vicingaceae bacterium]